MNEKCIIKYKYEHSKHGSRNVSNTQIVGLILIFHQRNDDSFKRWKFSDHHTPVGTN